MNTIIVRSLCAGALAVSTVAYAADSAVPTSDGARDKPSQSRSTRVHSDARMRRPVYQAIKHAGGVDTAAMTIRAKNGLVTLEGTVPDASQVSRAATISQSVPGVTSVKNRLRIEVEGN